MRNKEIFFWTIPLIYTFKTRLKTYKAIVAWIFSYIVPVTLLMSVLLSDLMILTHAIVGFMGLYGAYEVGYIYNDAELVKKEVNPTLRLSSDQRFFYENHKHFIYILKLVIVFLICSFLYAFKSPLFLSVSTSSCVILVTFSIYNSVRSRWSIPIYSLLVWMRYFGIIISFVSPREAMLLWVAYPLCVTLEFASKSRFNLKVLKFCSNYDKFRVRYYLLLFPLMGLIFYSWKDKVILFFAYFFVYRLFSWFLLASWFRK